jgi:hypothetical protein
MGTALLTLFTPMILIAFLRARSRRRGSAWFAFVGWGFAVAGLILQAEEASHPSATVTFARAAGLAVIALLGWLVGIWLSRRNPN